MLVQINTDNQLSGNEEQVGRLETQIAEVLGGLAERITRLEVHVGDQNGTRSGGADIRCSIEARLANRRPEAVSHSAATSEQAASGAAKKLRRRLQSSIGRLDARKGSETVRSA